MSGGYLVEPSASIVWTPGPRFSLNLVCGYFSIGGLHGSDTETAWSNYVPVSSTDIQPGQTIVYPNSAGADIEFLSVELSATLRL